MVMEISVAVIAFAFLILVIALIRVLETTRSSLEQTNKTLIQVQKQLEDVGGESVKLISQTREITGRVQGMLQSLDSTFLAISHVGDALEGLTSRLSSGKRQNSSFEESSCFADSACHSECAGEREKFSTQDGSQDKILDAVEWAITGFMLWQKLKKRR